jgi:hypothetical protein
MKRTKKDEMPLGAKCMGVGSMKSEHKYNWLCCKKENPKHRESKINNKVVETFSESAGKNQRRSSKQRFSLLKLEFK